MFGRQVRMPIDLMYGTPSPAPVSVAEYASNLRQALESAYANVRERMDRKLDREKELYDRKVHGKPLEIGDLVWLHCPAVPRVTQRNYIDLGVDLIVWYRRSPSKFFGFSTTRIVNVKSFILIASNYARQMFVYL